MPFQRRLIATRISLIISAGMLVLATAESAVAQANAFDCRPDPTGNGWICEATGVETGSQQPRSRDRYPGSPSAPRSVEAAPREPSTTAPGTAGTAPATMIPLRPAHELDWVTREQMTPEELSAVPANCCGAFIEPAREPVNADAEQNPESAPTVFQTETGIDRFADDTMSIDGNVIIRQGNRVVTNDRTTTISGTDGSVLMEGNIVFREPGFLLRGDGAYIDQESGENRVENARYVLHDYNAHGSAQSLVYSSASNRVTVVNGEFSRCEPDSNFWVISADSIVLDQERGRGYARGARIRVADVPVFYYPFTLTFPLSNERVSGLLAPSAGSTRDGGFDFELPYYLNLAPNYDATLSPRLIANRGAMINAEGRYLSGWSMNTLNLAHLAGDKKYELDSSGTPTVDSPPQEDRWFIGFEQVGALGQNWSTYIDYNAVSDDAYFEDLGASGLNVASRTHLNRQGRLEFQSSLLQGSLNVQRIQVLGAIYDPLFEEVDLNKPFDLVPQAAFATDLPLFRDLRFRLQGQYASFDRKLAQSLLTGEQIESGALVTGSRVNLEPELLLDLNTPGWYFRPSAKYKHIGYRLQDQALVTEQDPEVGVAVLSLDSGLVFERSMGLLDGFTQTLEPRLYYLNSNYEDQSTLPVFDSSEYSFSFNQLFRDDRFSGGDRIGDADQVTTAVTSRFLDGSGRERGRVSIGQIVYFQDRLVDLGNPLQAWVPIQPTTSDSSALVGELGFAFAENWRIKADLQWDQEEQGVDEGSVHFNYQSPDDLLLNMAYRFRATVPLSVSLIDPTIRTRIEQTDLSAVYPVNNNWRLLGRWNYDHSNSRNLETFAGVEFSNCCTTVRLVAREWVRQYELYLPDVQPNRGVFFQFTLHGLGNIAGGGLSSLLSDSISGFKDTSER